MTNKRVIARLDIKGPNLVKGVHLEGFRVLGKPEDFARYYYQNGADELFYQDVVASLYDRNSLQDLISQTAKKSFIPLTVGGGIRTLDDISKVLRAGADKVCINTAATRNKDFIREAANKFGSSTIVVAIEAIQQEDGRYFAFIDNGREETGLEIVSWAKEIQELGAGEIVITSVDNEGTGKGFNVCCTEMVAQNVDIPVIAHGGAGKLSHCTEIILNGHADAIAIASMIHYDFIALNKNDTASKTEGNLTFLNSGRTTFNNIESTTIKNIKKHLSDHGISCRI